MLRSKLKQIYFDLLRRKIKSKLKFVGENFQASVDLDSYGLENVQIGDNFKSGKRLKLRTFSNWEGYSYTPIINIGNNVNIKSDCHISAINRVEIGDNVLMASSVFISDMSHGDNNYQDIDIPPLKRKLYSKGPIIIEDNVWIGEKVTVLPNVKIGRCSIIGANSVVTKDVPSYSIAVGNPAKIIKRIEK